MSYTEDFDDTTPGTRECDLRVRLLLMLVRTHAFKAGALKRTSGSTWAIGC